MANRPGPSKVPFNAYITKQEKALLTAAARATGLTLTDVFRGLVDKLSTKYKPKRGRPALTRKGKKAKLARTKKAHTKNLGKVKGKVARKARVASVVREPGKRGPGRPKGSKNKPKYLPDLAPQVLPYPVPPLQVPLVVDEAKFYGGPVDGNMGGVASETATAPASASASVPAPAPFPVPRTTSYDPIEWPTEQASETPIENVAAIDEPLPAEETVEAPEEAPKPETDPQVP